MMQQARDLGANAVIGIDLDYETVGQGGSMLMVAAAGTAVVAGIAHAALFGNAVQLRCHLPDRAPGSLDVIPSGARLADGEADGVAALDAVLGQVETAAVVEALEQALVQGVERGLVVQSGGVIAEVDEATGSAAP